MRISDWSSDVCSSDLPSINLISSPVRGCSPSTFSGSRLAPATRPPRLAASASLATAAFIPVSNTSPVPPSFARSEEHTSELQSLMRNSYAVFCLKKKKKNKKLHYYEPIYTHINTTVTKHAKHNHT